eukprot:COSAG02_NODE_576_length_20112_cov_13.577625_10_plen_356_part_00
MLPVCRQVGGTASAKLKRGAMAAASAAVLNATASIAGDLVGVDRGGEKTKDGSVGGDRDLVRMSGIRLNVGFSVSPPAVVGTAAGGNWAGPVPFVACQLACCAAVALVRWRRLRRLDATGVVLGLVPVPAKPNTNFDGPVLVGVTGVAGVAGDIASSAPAATARATGPAPSSQPALRLNPPSSCATLLLRAAGGLETLRFLFPLGLPAPPAAAAAASRRLTSAGTNPAAAPEGASSLLSALPPLSSEESAARPHSADIRHKRARTPNPVRRAYRPCKGAARRRRRACAMVHTSYMYPDSTCTRAPSEDPVLIPFDNSESQMQLSECSCIYISMIYCCSKYEFMGRTQQDSGVVRC